MELSKNVRPFMTDEEIDTIDGAIDKILHNKGKISCLEWGSGMSTIYYCQKLKGRNFTWDSVEYNPDWLKEVEKYTDSLADIALFDYGGYTRDTLRKVCMKDYIDYPKTLNKKFDLVIIDGRCRMKCLEVAQEILDKGGLIYVHDADRPRYQKTLNEYNGKLVRPRLWVQTLS